MQQRQSILEALAGPALQRPLTQVQKISKQIVALARAYIACNLRPSYQLSPPLKGWSARLHWCPPFYVVQGPA